MTGFDARKNMVRLVYWSGDAVPSASFTLDGTRTEPTYSKKRNRDFLGSTFCWEHICWLPLGNATLLEAKVGQIPTSIVLRSERIDDGLDIDTLRLAFAKPAIEESGLPTEVLRLRKLARSPAAIEVYRDAWVFMDRDTEADDNAEHLYRYVRANHPDINAFFVLRREAPDWRRLEEEGFRLLEFNSTPHATRY